jgi:hypothetical protein
MLPGTFLYVYIGYVTGAAVGQQRERSTAEWVMLAIGLLATIAVTVYVTRLAKSKLGEEVDDDKVGPDDHSDDTKGSDETSVSPWRKHAKLIGAAIILASVAGVVQFRAEAIEQALSGLFGPPAVEMKETYDVQQNGATVDHSILQFDADNASLKLTNLYKWYGGDFEQVSGSVLTYAAQFSGARLIAVQTNNRDQQHNR